MPRIFVYEFITGGGTLAWPDTAAPSGSLLMEGSAMVRAVCRDFAKLDGIQPCVFWDTRLTRKCVAVEAAVEVVPIADRRQHDRLFAATLEACDEVLIIAPELFGSLLTLTLEAERHLAKRLSPSSEMVRIASSKAATVARLHAAGVPVPATRFCREPSDLPVDIGSADWILKPDDGAGSDAIIRTSGTSFDAAALDWSRAWCAQPFCSGRPASVAALCGGLKCELLPPTWQTLDAKLSYLGGKFMTDRTMAERARQLAAKALAAMPSAGGFVGVDLVLGSQVEDDVVIEVNPRLTTSYVGLSRISRTNLAGAMRDRVFGRSSELLFTDDPLEFDAQGLTSAGP